MNDPEELAGRDEGSHVGLVGLVAAFGLVRLASVAGWAAAFWFWLTVPTQCAWCKRFLRIPLILMKRTPVSHGMCRECADREFGNALRQPSTGKTINAVTGRFIESNLTNKQRRKQ